MRYYITHKHEEAICLIKIRFFIQEPLSERKVLRKELLFITKLRRSTIEWALLLRNSKKVLLK